MSGGAPGSGAVGAGLHHLGLGEDPGLEPVHEQDEAGDEDGDENDEDSLHAVE